MHRCFLRTSRMVYLKSLPKREARCSGRAKRGYSMSRFLKVLLTATLLSWPKAESVGQETTTADRLPEVHPLAGEILVWRPQSKKPERLSQASQVAPLDRVGTPGGSLGRI